MCYGYGFSGGGFGFLGALITLIIIIGIGYFAYRFFKSNKNIKGLNLEKKDDNKALEILNERYSRGEISDEEYNFKKSQILR
ncbi:MAG: SHOCT domain-containing protein [Clostridium perfringens]|nr:SHOCT domain-containing protein [Clostridium perfringens]